MGKLDLSSKCILIAVGSSLAFGRWGAWIGLPAQNLFIIDAILLLSAVVIFPKYLIKNKLMLSVIVLYCIYQFTRNPATAAALRLRDLMPYIYFVLFLILKNQINLIPKKDIYSMLKVSTLTGLIWNLLISINILKTLTYETFAGIPIFSQRADHFGIMAAVGIIVWSNSIFNSGKKRVFDSIVVCLFILEVILLPSRAGFLAMTVSCVFLLVKYNRRKIVKIIFLMITLTIASVPLSSTLYNLLPDVSVAKKTISFGKNNDILEQGAGTARGRLLGQNALVDWVSANNLQFVGGGPGREILNESGAVRWLSGNLDTRFPHNWWVSLYARFGIVGFLLWVFAFILIWRESFQKNFNFNSVIIVAILIASTFGVIIESPFGIIPLYFFLMKRNL